MQDIEKTLKKIREKSSTDPATVVPPEYHDFLDVFKQELADKLPAHSRYDHRIELLPETTAPNHALRKMSHEELLVLREWLDANLKKGFIRPSSSAAAAPVMFARKPGGGLRLCIDYRGLNAVTKRNRYPIPLIQETLTMVSRAKIFTKLDVIAAFNKLRISEGHEPLTAFKTRWGLFESLVMPFGLTNAPASWQTFINDILGPFLDDFCTAYIDDILIYSQNMKDHREHVRKVLAKLKEHGIQIDIDKCEFHVTETKYLGLIISGDGIRMDPEKVAAIIEWTAPRNVKDVQGFLGFANFYRRFILGFSRIAKPLTRLTQKDTKFQWTRECQKAFDNLKEAFSSAPVLKTFEWDKVCYVECDSSDYVTGGVLSQLDDQGQLRPVAYFSKTHNPAECNYEIYDKELMAIVKAFQEWRPELEGSPHPIQVITDHKNLEYFMTSKQLNRRQARWAEFLSRFQFKLTYRPGRLGGKPDALTRRSQDLPNSPDDPRNEYQNQTIIKPEHLDWLRVNVTTITDNDDHAEFEGNGMVDVLENDHFDPIELPDGAEGPEDMESTAEDDIDRASLEDLFREGYEHDPFPSEIIQMLRSGQRRDRRIALAECEDREGILYYRGRRYVPDYEKLYVKLFRHYHDSPLAGHPGRKKTYSLLARQYYWPRMTKSVERYTKNCHTCTRTKYSRLAYQGLLSPLPVPNRPWRSISVDFIVKLPLSHGYDSIMVVVDRLSKMRHFIPCNETIGPKEAAELFLKHVWRFHGLPDQVISDRGPQFASRFWKHLCELLDIKAQLSTAYHPETDGQTERINEILEAFIRAYCTYLQDDWSNWLPLAEFAHNNHDSETTGISPFFANYGFHPRMGFEPPENLQDTPAANFTSRLSEIHDRLREEMFYAQGKYEDSANRKRTPAPRYQVGDKVWLKTKNLKTRRPSRKLDHLWSGPYPVVKVINPVAYELRLPTTMKIHPVFHTNLLLPCASNPFPGQRHPEPGPVIVDAGEDFWEVEKILDSRIRYGHVQYYVKWKGWDIEDSTWQGVEDVAGAPEAVKEFHKRYPHKPSPSSQELAS
jgi:hypothetical protein